MVSCSPICCSQTAPKLLIHASLVLVIVSGAGVATLARLKWDPSTYILFRFFLPNAYRVLSAVLCFASFLMIVLAHLAVIAFSIRDQKNYKWRKALYFTYAALMFILILVELGTLAWMFYRIIEWINTGIPKEVAEALIYVIKTGSDVFATASKFMNKAANAYNTVTTALRGKRDIGVISMLITIITAFKNSLAEIFHDLPFNFLVGAIFIIVVAVMQPLSFLLAINSAYTYKIIDDGNDPATQLVQKIKYTKGELKPIDITISKFEEKSIEKGSKAASTKAKK